MDGPAVRTPAISSNDFEARLRDLVRNTFLSHNSSLLFRPVLAYRRRRYHLAIGAQIRMRARRS